MKLKFSVFIFAIFILSFFAGGVFAQEDPEKIAKKYGITFPISELGGCSDYYTCRQYCEDPAHYETCIDFAKKKGFYEEEKVKLDIRNSDFWEKTEDKLGCNSVSSCRAFCENPENFDKCDSFARENKLSGGHVDDPYEEEFLKKAKEFLGCDSVSTCMNFCDKEGNRDKCSEFAREMGFRGGEEFVGPGGCNSEETCRTFCSDPANYKICQEFSSAHGGKFSGPGGCSSPELCETYCREHKEECSFDASTTSDYSPSEWCSKTPDCAWTGDTCQCSKIEGLTPQEYCNKYPDRCSGYGDPSAECAKYPGCSWNGSTCQCEGYSGSYGSYDPAAECSKYTGCSWTNNNCECSGSYPAEKGVENPEAECVKYPGCSWNGNYCDCPSSSGSYQDGTSGTYDPATECAKNAGCSWTGTDCQCSGGSSEPAPQTQPTTSEQQSYPQPTPGVYGVSVARNLFQVLLQYLFGN